VAGRICCGSWLALLLLGGEEFVGVLPASWSGKGLLEPVIGIRAAGERGHFPVAVAGVQPPGFDEVAAGVQPQRGYLMPACVGFQAVKEPGGESPAAGRGNHEDAGDLGGVTGQQAEPGASQHVSFCCATSSRPRGGARSWLGSSLMAAAISSAVAGRPWYLLATSSKYARRTRRASSAAGDVTAMASSE
jgi:hypothetical protein